MNFSEALQDQALGQENSGGKPSLVQNFQRIRAKTLELCAPLSPEDYIIQSIPDVSPPKWHLAHTTWFFETFLLKEFFPQYREFHPDFNYLFNSYYKGVGKHYPRSKRGLLSRPPLKEILNYREYVDRHMFKLLKQEFPREILLKVEFMSTLGLHHEQQHQELLLTDIKHILATQPLCPVYRERIIPLQEKESQQTIPLSWQNFPEGLYEIGYEGTPNQNSFAFDNESPRHRVWLEAYSLSSRLVTNDEYLEFIQEGGYKNPLLWLSDGWDWVLSAQAKAPLYWEQEEVNSRSWSQRTLAGKLPLHLDEPVCHLNYYEAEAFARWVGKRLPTEAEWEVAAATVTKSQQKLSGNFLESEWLHPAPLSKQDSQLQLFGNVWEWTSSPYTPYPGFQPTAGAVGEYNGKFMCNQMVLRGGSCFTPQDHLRITYRNFFSPSSQWQMTGLRLASDT